MKEKKIMKIVKIFNKNIKIICIKKILNKYKNVKLNYNKKLKLTVKIKLILIIIKIKSILIIFKTKLILIIIKTKLILIIIKTKLILIFKINITSTLKIKFIFKKKQNRKLPLPIPIKISKYFKIINNYLKNQNNLNEHIKIENISNKINQNIHNKIKKN
jgi:hypothetical protein